MEVVSSSTPRKVSDVVRPTIFSGFNGMLSVSHSESILESDLPQACESLGPAKK